MTSSQQLCLNKTVVQDAQDICNASTAQAVMRRRVSLVSECNPALRLTAPPDLRGFPSFAMADLRSI